MDHNQYLLDLKKTLEKVDDMEINKAVLLISSYIGLDEKILVCGNGGSAMTASHFVTDWLKMPMTKKDRNLNIISLCDNAGVLTAYANDMGYEDVFSEQVRAYGRRGDLLLLVSGSGNSANLIKASQMARKMDIKTLAVVGYDGGKLKKICDHYVHVPSFDMQICEDIHLIFGHIVMRHLIS